MDDSNREIGSCVYRGKFVQPSYKQSELRAQHESWLTSNEMLTLWIAHVSRNCTRMYCYSQSLSSNDLYDHYNRHKIISVRSVDHIGDGANPDLVLIVMRLAKHVSSPFFFDRFETWFFWFITTVDRSVPEQMTMSVVPFCCLPKGRSSWPCSIVKSVGLNHPRRSRTISSLTDKFLYQTKIISEISLCTYSYLIPNRLINLPK